MVLGHSDQASDAQRSRPDIEMLLPTMRLLRLPLMIFTSSAAVLHHIGTQAPLKTGLLVRITGSLQHLRMLSRPCFFVLKGALCSGLPATALAVRDGSNRLRRLLHSVARVASSCLVLLHSLVGSEVHRVHLISEDFLERGCSWQALRGFHLLLVMSTAKLAHLGLNISEILVLRVICLNPSIILHGLHRSLLIIHVLRCSTRTVIIIIIVYLA